MIKPREILSRLEEKIGIAGRPTRLRTTIEEVLRDDLALPSIEAAEKAESLEEKIRELIYESEESNVLPILKIVTSAEHLVSGYSHINPSDSPEIVAAKLGRLHTEPLLDAIRKLSFSEFELFGARILKELKAKTVNVTPHSDDHGIDFYGVLSLGQNSFLPIPFGKLAHDVRLRFAGQAKHYPTRPIGPELIRELIGSISLARHKVFTSKEDPFEELGLRPFNPLVAMFFTTGRFTSGALELAEKSGVITKSGEELAVFLADKGIGMKNIEGKPKFDKKLFQKWLSTK